MRRPPTKTMLLGHPLVATPVIVTGTLGLFAGLYGGGGNGLLLAFAFGGMGLAASRAKSEAGAFKQWQREWDEMAGLPDPRPGRRKAIVDTVLAALMLAGICVVWQADASTRTLILGWAILLGLPVLALLAIGVAIRWRRHRPPRAMQVVTVQVIAETRLPVPTLTAAYAALPSHCRALLGGRQ